MSAAAGEHAILFGEGGARLEGSLIAPAGVTGLVVFAHGSGSSRHSPRNRFVARVLGEAGLATFLVDLLSAEEERAERETREHRFDIGLLSRRLHAATEAAARAGVAGPVGYFGASTGAAAALVAAAERTDVAAVVSRGGRPDLAGEALDRVAAPTLLVIGGADRVVLELNRQALRRLRAEKRLEVIPGATHLFEEPGALEEVACLARAWFMRHLAGSPGPAVVSSG